MTIKPIETHYKGYRFRSRLEARWAIFFDKVSIPYRYETEGFDLNGIWYLPDFKMNYGNRGSISWIEIKPGLPTSQECEKAIRLCIAKRQNVYILAGDVWPGAYKGYVYLPINPESTAEFLRSVSSELHFQWRSSTQAIWIEEGEECVLDLKRGFLCANTEFVQCPQCNTVFLLHGMEGCECDGDDFETNSPFLRSAYVSARHARFEHGEVPA